MFTISQLKMRTRDKDIPYCLQVFSVKRRCWDSPEFQDELTDFDSADCFLQAPSQMFDRMTWIIRIIADTPALFQRWALKQAPFRHTHHTEVHNPSFVICSRVN